MLFCRIGSHDGSLLRRLEFIMGTHRVLHIKKSFEIIAKDDSSPSFMMLFLSDQKSSRELTSKDLPTAKMCSLFISVMIELMKMLPRFFCVNITILHPSLRQAGNQLQFRTCGPVGFA